MICRCKRGAACHRRHLCFRGTLPVLGATKTSRGVPKSWGDSKMVILIGTPIVLGSFPIWKTLKSARGVNSCPFAAAHLTGGKWYCFSPCGEHRRILIRNGDDFGTWIMNQLAFGWKGTSPDSHLFFQPWLAVASYWPASLKASSLDILEKANSDKQPSFKTVTLLAEAIQIGLYIASHITALPLATFLEDLATSVTRSKCLGTAFFLQSPLECSHPWSETARCVPWTWSTQHSPRKGDLCEESV